MSHLLEKVILGASLCVLLFAAPNPGFDVASIRPHNPNSPGATLKFLPGGALSISGMSIGNLVSLAWHFPAERVSGGPKWFYSDLYDIEAKSPAGSSSAMDPQYLRIQALLAERFQLKVHRETKDSPVYLLTVAKTGLRMQAANGADHYAPEKGTILPWEAFVGDLSRRMGRPIIDKTGLKGAWFVKLLYATDDGQAAGLGVQLDRTQPPSGPSIFTAVQEQLGLKLDSGRAPVDQLIIDSVSRPSPN